jgi:hypothetical protein
MTPSSSQRPVAGGGCSASVLPQAACLAMAVATSLVSRKPGTSFIRSTDPITTEKEPKRPSSRSSSGVLTPWTTARKHQPGPGGSGDTMNGQLTYLHKKAWASPPPPPPPTHKIGRFFFSKMRFNRTLSLSVVVSAAAFCCASNPAQALTVQAAVNGVTYDVTTFTGTYDANTSKFALPPSGLMPWWGSQSIASQFATQVWDRLGFICLPSRP